MKKLTVLLAAVMAFAFSASAYAATPSDLAEQSVTVQDAFAKTMALGIINGYEDGTVGPEQNITRAEFAKIAVTAAGAKDTADMLANNNSSFKDVKAGQWYTGWINASESLGIFQGDGNGNFRPNDTITNQEVITVLMRLLGYNDNLTGTWPVNYVTQANKTDILDDVAIVASAPATRADVVVMLDATLDANLVTYDKDTNEFVKKQTTKGGTQNTDIPLLQDSFKGAYDEEASFNAITEVRDAAKQTLNMTITPDSSSIPATLIIDDETRVSANGGSLFDLAGHQGKVYFVKDGDKYYARFIEVESYTKTVTDAPKLSGTKVEVNKTNYNGTIDSSKVSTVTWTTNAPNNGTGSKNSNYILYFNDDDQVYAVKSDKDMVGTDDGYTYYVRTTSSSTVKLFGSKSTNKTISTSDDVLIYTESGFIAPTDLKVGDAIRYVSKDLYVMVDEVEGTLSKQTTSGSVIKYTIDGKSLVATSARQLDDEYEQANVDIDDIYGNTVKYIQNKDNTISAIIVDATSTGTKLYGIVIGGDGTQGWGNNATASAISIFTAEGKTVTYDLDLEGNSKLLSFGWSNAIEPGDFIEYKLNKDGEIKTINTTYDYTLSGSNGIGADGDGKIEIDDNKYVGTSDAVLADNAVIFEVDWDDDDIDPTIVTRSSFLSEDDITPANITNDNGNHTINAYFAAFTNNNDEIKAMAYTESSGTTYYYGVADGDQFNDADHTVGIAFVGDEESYDLDTTASTLSGGKVTNKDLVIYTKSGSTVVAKARIEEKASINAVEVAGWSNGRMTFDTDITPWDEVVGTTHAAMGTVKTDENTVVYVMNSVGEFELADVDSISKGAYVNVVLVDDEDYAELVIVDEYNF